MAEAAQGVHSSEDVRLDQMATQSQIAVPGQQVALEAELPYHTLPVVSGEERIHMRPGIIEVMFV